MNTTEECLLMTKRWQTFFVLAFLFSVGFFYRVSMAVVAGDLVAELRLSAAELGAISGAFFYAFAFAQIPLGPMIDRLGGKLMISICGIATICGSLVFSLATGYRSALAGRVLLGLGTACVLMGSLKIFTFWFTPREFPKVAGFMIAAGNLGSVSATAPLALAISYFSWRPTFMAVTLIQVVATLSVFLFVHDRPQGCPAAPAQSTGQTSHEQINVLVVWKMLYTAADFWLVALIAFFWYANYMVLLALWGGPYLVETIGLSRELSGSILLCISLGFISGSLLIGKVIDWCNGALEKTILGGQIALLLLMTIMLGPAEKLSQPLLAVIFFLIGLVSGSGTIIYPLARKIVPDRYAATAMTGVNFFLLLGAATTQHIMGHYIGSFSRGAAGYPPEAYHGAFLIPICGLACTLTLFVLRKMQKGFDGAKKAEAVPEG